MFGRKRFRLATAVILFLLLTVALAPAAAAQPNSPPPPDPPADDNGGTPPAPPPGGNGGGTATPSVLPPDGTGGTPPAPPPGVTATPDPPGTGGTMNPAAPSWPPSELIVAHAATQVQLTSVGDGLQTYFIGTDGTGHSGPYIDSFSNLAQQHTAGGAVTLYTGTNPGTGKPVTIYYLPTEQKVRISTYYPDNQYDTNKPYVLTIDSGHNVIHDQW